MIKSEVSYPCINIHEVKKSVVVQLYLWLLSALHTHKSASNKSANKNGEMAVGRLCKQLHTNKKVDLL